MTDLNPAPLAYRILASTKLPFYPALDIQSRGLTSRSWSHRSHPVTMPWNPSNELLKKYLEDLDRRQPCKRGLLGPCPFGFNHKGVLSQGLNQRENIGRRFEIVSDLRAVDKDRT